jgi:mxaL protein
MRAEPGGAADFRRIVANRWQRHIVDPTTLGLSAAAGLLALAWLDPGWTAQRPQHDMVVVLDVTQSMNVADMPMPEAGPDAAPQSRLARSRGLLLSSLARLPCGSRLGLAIFTEYRSLMLLAPMEVCENYRELKATLSSIDTRMAWSGNSEVAKALYGALRAAAALPSHPAVVFMTDGHETPPVNPRHRPNFDGKPGEISGLVVGVGGDQPLPIPRQDPAGRPIGTWGANDVLQVDPRTLGRGGSQDGETLAEDANPVAPMPGATPGREHLSSLREDYLKLLARESQLEYHRLRDADGLLQALLSPTLAHEVPSRLSLRWPASVLALGLLLGLLVRAWWLGLSLR